MSQENPTVSQKSRLILLILYLFPPFNAWSVYNFYAGKTVYGLFRIALLLVAGKMVADDENSIALVVLLLWGLVTLIDFFKIILGKQKDKEGNFISDWKGSANASKLYKQNAKKNKNIIFGDAVNQNLSEFGKAVVKLTDFCLQSPQHFTAFEERTEQNFSDKYWFPQKYIRCNVTDKVVPQYSYIPQESILFAISGGDELLYGSARVIQNDEGKKVNHICVRGNSTNYETEIVLPTENIEIDSFIDSFKLLSECNFEIAQFLSEQENTHIGTIFSEFCEKLDVRRKEFEIEKQEEERRIKEEAERQRLIEEENERKRIEEEQRRIEEKKLQEQKRIEFEEELARRRAEKETRRPDEEKQKALREKEEAARCAQEEAKRRTAEEKAYKEAHPELAQAFDDLDSL